MLRTVSVTLNFTVNVNVIVYDIVDVNDDSSVSNTVGVIVNVTVYVYL